MKTLQLYIAKDGKAFTDEKVCLKYEKKLGDEELPYTYLPISIDSQERLHNKNYDQDATCKCGHPYHRHFDSYEDNLAVGCKYCQCYTFSLKKQSKKIDCQCENH